MSLLYILFLLPMVVSLKTEKSVVLPKNTAVVAGNAVSMECGSLLANSQIQWKFKNMSDTSISGRPINDRKNIIGDYLQAKILNGSQIALKLTITQAEFKHAGTYTCIVSGDVEQLVIYSAELVVLSSECGSNVSSENFAVWEGSDIEMWCMMRYYGNLNLEAFMTWSRNDNKELFYETVNEVNATLRTVTSKVTLKLYSGDNGLVINCLSFFNATNADDNYQPAVGRACNAPEYKIKRNFTANVLYGPRNISITPVKTLYDHGDILQCSAVGNPLPVYRWISVATGLTKEGPQLAIDNLMTSDSKHLYRCTATNMISGANSSIDVDITLSDLSGISSMKVVTILLGITATALFIVLVAIRMKDRIRPTFEDDVIGGPDIVRYADALGDEVSQRREGIYVDPDDLAANMEPQCSYTKHSLEFPIYAQVNKCCIDANSAMNNYSDERAKQISDEIIEYMDLNSVGSKSQVTPPMPQSSKFNRSNYASIDHSIPQMDKEH